jgi:hypothetical protein
VLPWVVAGLAVLGLITLGVVLAQGGDDESTTTDTERETTTSETPSTTTTSEPSTTTTEPVGTVLSPQFLVGDCFNDTAHGTSEAGEISRVDCASSHDGEVYALPKLPGAPGAPYPGDEQIAKQGDQLCVDQFAPYVGIDYFDSQWDYAYYAPIEETWRKFDDREIVCFLIDPELNKIEGSKRNSRT